MKFTITFLKQKYKFYHACEIGSDLIFFVFYYDVWFQAVSWTYKSYEYAATDSVRL